MRKGPSPLQRLPIHRQTHGTPHPSEILGRPKAGGGTRGEVMTLIDVSGEGNRH